MIVDQKGLILILTFFQVMGTYGRRKIAGWKEASYKEQKSKGYENPVIFDSEQYAVSKACPWKKPFVKSKRPIKCRENNDCPNAFYCQKVISSNNPKERIHHSVCCRYQNFTCESPAEILKARSSRIYISCNENSDCPEYHTCSRTEHYSLCCPDQLIQPAGLDDNTQGCLFNGNVVEDGYKSDDVASCTKCKCKEQQMVCKTRKNCMCEYNGVTYGNMEEFMEGDCSTCKCKHGKVACKEDRCKPCKINTHGTMEHLQSEYFDDTCQECECINGELTCTDNPACTCEDDGIKYAHNSEFTQEDDCVECKCRHGNVSCEPAKRCECKHDGKPMQHGGTMTDFDGCTICHCSNQLVSCPERPECNVCIDGGKEYKPGQSYLTSDRCRWCVCISRNKSECRVISRSPECQK
ncbi:unnamed protein product [Owenia fusiformis]|uniref:Uncharacterized protein n=1 Tax=Owenia fusiformis TaxID=6347 RepID=A0A8J1UBZ1_OWEFU|nr:unnamed protein product [Owenia fusiformis]